jgi:Phage integrase, N-terminal SAM-like domain
MAQRARSPSGASREAATNRGGRPRSGDVVEWQRKNGDRGYGVRFYDAEGVRHYERYGLESEGWSRRRPEIELENFVRLVDAGAYVATPDARPTQEQDPLFGGFARAFLAEHAVEVKPKTREFYENLLEQHLAPYFEKQRLTQISWSSIDAYKKQRLMLMQRIRAARARGNPLRDSNLQPLRLSSGRSTIRSSFWPRSSTRRYAVRMSPWPPIPRATRSSGSRCPRKMSATGSDPTRSCRCSMPPR